MKRIIPALAVFLFLSVILLAENIESKIVYFESNKSELTENAKIELIEILKRIKEKPVLAVKIHGYTDSDGSHMYNDSLSRIRAEKVLDYLITNGADKSKISIEYYGEGLPVATNENTSGKGKNRRVEVSIEYEVLIPESFNVSFSEFTVNTNRDTILVLNPNGTCLHIPKYCFVDKNGKTVNGSVTLSYREYTNSAEMAFSNIPMTYKLGGTEYSFNSSGMFELRGAVNNSPVEIAKYKTIKADYALAVQNPDINFYQLNQENKWLKVQDIKPIKDLSKNKKKVKTEEVVGNDGERRTKRSYKKFKETMVIDGVRVSGGDSIGMDFRMEREDRLVETVRANVSDAGHTYPGIIRGLSVGKFGVYNCDQIYRLPNPIEINARYVDTEGKEIKQLRVLSMINLKYNGAFSFDPERFVCDAGGANILALFTKKGELFILDKEAFAAMNISKSGKYTFTMKNMTSELKSSKDLADYLGI